VKQAPSWNEVVQKFATNPDVKFGDIALSDGGPRGGEGANPGGGGWPTIRYYNKETGTLGKSYEKKTDASMCDELGPKGGLMQPYVEEAGSTSECSVVAPYAGCGDKQKKFIEKMAGKLTAGEFDVDKQVVRLTAMKEKPMKAELKQWLNQRLAILKGLAKLGAAEPEHEEL